MRKNWKLHNLQHGSQNRYSYYIADAKNVHSPNQTMSWIVLRDTADLDFAMEMERKIAVAVAVDERYQNSSPMRYLLSYKGLNRKNQYFHYAVDVHNSLILNYECHKN